MRFELRMKTGFFETKTYSLFVGCEMLLLSESGGRTTAIPEKEIIAITLDEKAAQIEIQTADRTYLGLLSSKSDSEPLFEALKGSLNTKITYEYEGGPDHS